MVTEFLTQGAIELKWLQKDLDEFMNTEDIHGYREKPRFNERPETLE